MRSSTIRVLLFLIVLLNEYQASIIRHKRYDDIQVNVVNKYIGNDLLFVCTVQVSSSKDVHVAWYKNNERLDDANVETKVVSYNPHIIESTLITNSNDNAKYICYSSFETPGNSLNGSTYRQNIIESSFGTESERTIPCDINEATCRNGQCISRSGLCDGRNDCSDGSDEASCTPNHVPGRCEPNERSCGQNQCLQKIWWCDGEKDCENGFDESGCSSLPTSGSCKGHEFECKSRNQCVLKSFLCDKEFDCLDQSDEIGCEPPRVVQFPIRNITISLGGTFTIECKAVGFPHPFINWRLNWGHTCEDLTQTSSDFKRCYSTNLDGHGTFTVTDVRYEDAGAYSCEAISSMGRIFAVPDTMVTVTGYARPSILPPPTTRPPTPAPVYIPEPDNECNCHSHSNECTCSGICRYCQHNTEGDHCERCKPGYIGIPRDGGHCVLIGEKEPFERPTIRTTRQTTYKPLITRPALLVSDDGCSCYGRAHACTCSGFCLNCTGFTTGKYCDSCLKGYEEIGDLHHTGHCAPKLEYQDNDIFQDNEYGKIRQYNDVKKSNKNKECNEYGTSHQSGNSCKCKIGVTGDYCDECKPRYFNLLNDKNNRKGCLSCFCNGLSVGCQQSNLFYRKKISEFANEDWYLSNKFTQLKENLNLIQNGVEFDKINNFENEDLFFIVSSKFKGNHLLSYNGEISFNFKFALSDDSIKNIEQLEIRISGSNINMIHVLSQDLIPNIENEISVKINEVNFQRYGDNNTIEREFLLIALSNIDLIMIKAKISNKQTSASISKFSLQHADSSDSSLEQASSVESCVCPEGYNGSSCESCAPGYKRSAGGFYWGFCEPI